MTSPIMTVRAPIGASRGWLGLGDLVVPCALGGAGIVPADKAREGDRATPAGRYGLEMGYYRADRLAPPPCALPLKVIEAHWGWCDDPQSPDYNRLIKKPFAVSHEDLWRTDHRYDLFFVLDFNRQPVVPGRGSAIFLHMTDESLPPTLGCVACRPDDLLKLAALMGAVQEIDIVPI
ncbi:MULTISPECIES: L,D-transpeptidase family protein [unclassified Iodidimonas]|jgi:L,D-peptidoglycan transpeptidase YkuD (ErfK/YbiS/YcfS/YnhG family)|uniref:L,D-transpeptidase family protein n=1 Tax=unclassified Iodidimonas TaxID=2626145 RepID=UPI0024822506|nr:MULTISPECIES: L,D-transpeptidase family protein [unclassified Iodidimonas]